MLMLMTRPTPAPHTMKKASRARVTRMASAATTWLAATSPWVASMARR